MRQHGIVVNPYYLNIMEKKQQPDGKLILGAKKLHKKLLKDNSMPEWILKNYSGEMIENFEEILVY